VTFFLSPSLFRFAFVEDLSCNRSLNPFLILPFLGRRGEREREKRERVARVRLQRSRESSTFAFFFFSSHRSSSFFFLLRFFMADGDSAAAAAAAAALRRKRVLERGKDRLKSITVGGPKGEDLPSAAAATAAIEPKEEAAAATTATTEAALPPPPTTTSTSTAARGAAAVLDKARTEVPPSPRAANRSSSKGGAAGATGTAAAGRAATLSAEATQLLLARRATAEDVALAALRASSAARLFVAAAAPILLPMVSRSLSSSSFAVENGRFQILAPLATALATLSTSRPLLVLLALQAWLLCLTSALLVSRPAALGASLEDSPEPAGPLRSLAKLAGFARGEEAARRLRWVAVAADALSAARDAAAVYLVSAVAVTYYASFSLAREMDSVVGGGGGGGGGGAAAAVEESWS
jgi:hypothetical protein